MKKLFLFIILCSLFNSVGKAQQIKRSTISSTGKISTLNQYRVTSTTGGCPGCSVLHPTSPANTGYLRQGFQQPPLFNDSVPGCATVSNFMHLETQTTCGLRFDFEYTGNSVTDVIFAWDFGADAFPQNSSLANPSGVFYTTSGLKTVNLTITKGYCVSSASTIISVPPTKLGLGVKATVADVKCYGDKTGSITALPVGGKSPYSYTWSNGSTGNILNGIASNRYQVTITDGGNCKIVLDTVVSQPSLPLSVTAIKIDETCASFKDGSVSLNPLGGTKPYTYKWSNGITDALADTLIPGKYTVSVKDNFGCKLDTAFTIIDRCKKTLATYDIITPNGDGINDTWLFPHIEDYPNNQLFIYNRWGQVVYSKAGYTGDWGGQNNDNQPLLTGAFFYVLRLNDTKQTVFSGSVTVLR